MAGQCRLVVASEHWCKRSDYSDGDQIISDRSTGAKEKSSLSTWKQAGVSHHLVKVVEQLSKFRAS